MTDSVEHRVSLCGISHDGSTNLYVIRHKIVVKYREEILVIPLYPGDIGDDFILMVDNARPMTIHRRKR